MEGHRTARLIGLALAAAIALGSQAAGAFDLVGGFRLDANEEISFHEQDLGTWGNATLSATTGGQHAGAELLALGVVWVAADVAVDPQSGTVWVVPCAGVHHGTTCRPKTLTASGTLTS